MSEITRVAAKVRAFRSDHPIDEYAIVTDFTEDTVGDVARVVGHCRIVKLDTGQVVAEAYGTRALRAPKPGAQGHLDTRDPDRAMTQATGRALGLAGYADGESLEGDTDEPDESGENAPVRKGGVPDCAICGKTLAGSAVKPTPNGPVHADCVSKGAAKDIAQSRAGTSEPGVPVRGPVAGNPPGDHQVSVEDGTAGTAKGPENGDSGVPAEPLPL